MPRHLVSADVTAPAVTLARITAMFVRHEIQVESLTAIQGRDDVRMTLVAVCPERVSAGLLRDRLDRLVDVHAVDVETLARRTAPENVHPVAS